MREFSAHPTELLRSAWRNRSLIHQMSMREVIGRYRGSYFGLAWSFLNPLLMLGVYTFVFTVVFQARWQGQFGDTTSEFAVILFAGLILHNLLAECISRAPGLIVSNINYVKKVVFPLEILAWVMLAASLFHAISSLLILVVVQLLLSHTLPWTAVLLPVVVMPLIFASLGLTWFLAGLGVYLRDIGQVSNVITRILLYISGIFFPLAALPLAYRRWFELNPLAVIIQQARDVLLMGKLPDPGVLALLYLLGALMMLGGFAFFQKARRGFADVL